jgi:hypothetical protein
MIKKEHKKIIKPKVIWEPQEGAQKRYMSCPIFEVLMEGNRGGGKTDALLMTYAQYVGRGYGQAWRGIIFRETFPNLKDIIAKSLKWFSQIFPDAKYNKSNHSWQFKTGETLYFAFARTSQDYWNYHGHEYPFVGWEELTNWPSSDLYTSMMSVCRSSHKEVPRLYRSTCNPFGKGHTWVKRRFIDKALPEEVISEGIVSSITGETLYRDRCYIHSELIQNKIFLDADPEYILNLEQLDDPNKKEAWLKGSWDIVAGGMFDDIWERNLHVIKPFKIPSSWYVDRSFDWGSSKPFSVGYWAMSDGTPVEIEGKQRTFSRGTLIRIAEWYGCEKDKINTGLKMTATDVGKGMRVREEALMRIYDIDRINAGPADSSIFDQDHNAESIDQKVKEGYETRRDLFVRANKSPGSRVKGWELVRNMMKESKEFPMEHKGLFVFNTCKNFISTVPILSRDEKNIDDVDTDLEDHIADEMRYRCLHKPTIRTVRNFVL